MKILAFAASNNLNSINKKLVQYALAQLELKLQGDVQIDLIDLNDFEMVIYRPDREALHGIPEEARRFNEKILQADALIISFAEYNGAYTSAYKNIFDWVSRIDMNVYQDKPSLIMGASPGPRGARNVLKFTQDIAPFFGMDIKAMISIPSFQEHFDLETDQMTSEKYSYEIESALSQLA